jgi:CRP-like cAMP-binding protein
MDHADVLRLAREHPALSVPDGDTVIVEGDAVAVLYVLASGALEVRVGDRVIASFAEPGSVVGEIGLLLGTPASADVIAVGDTVVHRVDDATALFTDHPDFGRHLAVELARRLRHVTTFLGDIERQFADRKGTLGLVPDVLSGLLGGSVADVDAGSDREPDSPY